MVFCSRKTLLYFLSVLFTSSIFFFLPNITKAGQITLPPNNLGLVGYWSFEDATGTIVTDFSGNGNVGTLTNMDANTDWVAGKLGKALDFDGTDDYVSVGDTSSFKFLHGGLNTSAFTSTISFWIKINDISLQEVSGIMSTGDAGSSTVGINVYYDNENDTRRLTYSITNGLGGQPVIFAYKSSFFPNDNNWHLVTITYDQALGSANAKFYLDGTYIGPSNKAGNTPSTSNSYGALRLGSIVYDGLKLRGKLDDVRVYNRVLTDSEITKLYNRSSKVIKVKKDPNTTGLVGYWSFEDGSGSKVTDFSGYGNTGIAYGTETWVDGRVGKAMYFNGTNGRILVGDTSTFKFLHGALDTSSFQWTMSYWIKRDNPLSEIMPIGNNDSSSSAVGVTTYINPDRQLYLAITNGNTGQSVIAGYATGAYYPNDTSWHLVTITYDQALGSANAKFYVDGSFVGSLNKNANTPSTGNQSEIFRIGSAVFGGTGSYFVDGAMDEVRIYNRALSASEITSLYDYTKLTKINSSQNSKLTDGLVGLWSFDGKDTRIAGLPGVYVSGAGSSEVHGIYRRMNDLYNGKYSYGYGGCVEGSYGMFYDVNGMAGMGSYSWTIMQMDALCDPDLMAIQMYESVDFDEYKEPWLASWNVLSGDSPAPTVSEISGEGIAYDRSSNANNGTLKNGGDQVAGKIGQGISFDGSNDYISTEFTPNYSSGITYSFWVKNTVSSVRYLHGDVNSTAGTQTSITADGTVNYLVYNSGSLASVTTTGVVNDGNWHHIAVTWTGTTATNGVKIYIDGVLDAQGTSSGTITTAQCALFIGDTHGTDCNFHSAGQMYNASMDDFRVYNRAVTSDEVKFLYNMGR